MAKNGPTKRYSEKTVEKLPKKLQSDHQHQHLLQAGHQLDERDHNTFYIQNLDHFVIFLRYHYTSNEPIFNIANTQ